jgi:predicted amidohydrolase
MKFTASCIQVNSQNNMAANIQTAINLLERASEQGADFIALPENVAFMSKMPEELYANSYFVQSHPALSAFKDAAKKYGKWILVGSLAIKITEEAKLANRSFLINPQGELANYYDKIHLFDTSIKGGETHKESDRFVSGNSAVCSLTPWGEMGMTICYDVRFPHLYRHLAKNGAAFITVPAAFTQFTGQAHWHVLLRARAIETGCYIIAPAQTGTHPSGRKTYGHSLIINPWGDILADGGEGVGVITAQIDIDKVTEIRQQMPSLEHDRAFKPHQPQQPG